MRRVLRLFLACQLLSVGAALADDGEPPRTLAIDVMRSALAGQAAVGGSSAWDVVTEGEWLVLELDGRPVLEGTSITIVFRSDGRVSGNAGTNNYMGTYERTGPDGLKLSDLGATRMYLDLPPGRMQQETKYLDTLTSVERFTLDDDKLTLWAGADRSIQYVRAQ